MSASAWIRYRCQICGKDWTNLSLARARNRQFQGFLVSMHQSGTHWVKHLLSMVLVQQHNLSQPEHIGDNSVVGGVKQPPVHPEVPHIVHSHSIPSPLIHGWPMRSLLRFPRYVLLVRDMRAALVSHWEKHKQDYPGCTFSEFLRGDPAGRRFDKDIWWDLRFLNAWHRVGQRIPSRVLLVHYERLRQDTVDQLRLICGYLKLGQVTDQQLKQAAAASSKDRMAKRENPHSDRPVVRKSKRDPVEWFSPADRRFFEAVTSRYLKNNFGYNYQDWRWASRPPALEHQGSESQPASWTQSTP